jgi:hypothetical protein
LGTPIERDGQRDRGVRRWDEGLAGVKYIKSGSSSRA